MEKAKSSFSLSGFALMTGVIAAMLIGMFILNILKTILPVLGRMTGMDAATVNRQRRHAYNELLFHHPDSLSEYDKQWLNM